MIYIPKKAPALWGSAALMGFAAVSAPQVAVPQSRSPARAFYKSPGVPGHSVTSYPAGIGKRGRRDIVLNGPERYKSRGPFALKGWNAHGVVGSRVNRRHESQHR